MSILIIRLPFTTIGLSSEPIARDELDPEEFGVEERSLSNTLDVGLMIPGLVPVNIWDSDDVESAESNEPLADNRFLKLVSSCCLHLLSKSDCIFCCLNFSSSTCFSSSNCLLLVICCFPSSTSELPSRD